MIKGVIFDVDGVLLDSFEANHSFMSDLVSHFGYKRPTRDQFRPIFHLDYFNAIKILTGLTLKKDIEKIARYGLQIHTGIDYDNLASPPQKTKETLTILHKKIPLGNCYQPHQSRSISTTVNGI